STPSWTWAGRRSMSSATAWPQLWSRSGRESSGRSPTRNVSGQPSWWGRGGAAACAPPRGLGREGGGKGRAGGPTWPATWGGRGPEGGGEGGGGVGERQHAPPHGVWGGSAERSAAREPQRDNGSPNLTDLAPTARSD